MAFQVSIGDAFLLGQAALKLGRAFTSGRKSAPSEFREVENQLYSLSAALSALHDSGATGRPNASQDTDVPGSSQLEGEKNINAVLSAVLGNCRSTLSHLKEIVDKYGKMKDTVLPQEPLFKRWSKKLATDFNKIKWTTEGGDLATLRSQLMVHVNCINMILGVMNSTHVGRMEGTLTGAMGLLKEIRDYVALGPRDILTKTSGMPVAKEPPLAQSYFELYLATNSGEELLCPTALLNRDWDKSSRASLQNDADRHISVFTCKCRGSDDPRPAPHTQRFRSFRISPLTFAVRLVEPELSWMIYKVADNERGRHANVIIRKLSPAHMLDFEELFVHELSVERARHWCGHGMGTTLAFVTVGSAGQKEARVLNLLSDVSASQPHVESVSITFMGRTYLRSDIQDIQMTHYTACNVESLSARDVEKAFKRQAQETADIVIYYGDPEDGTNVDVEDVVKTTLTLRFDTRVELSDKDPSVTFSDIHCSSTGSDGESHDIESGNASIAFATRSAARFFKEKVELLRKELSIISLRQPRSNEVPVVEMQVGGVHTEEVTVAEADITIVQNVTDNRYRLIIASHDGRTVVSQKLSLNIAESEFSGLNFRSFTWFVHIEENGRTQIRKLPNGFTHLVLSDVRTHELFGSWVRRQLWQRSLPVQNVPALTRLR